MNFNGGQSLLAQTGNVLFRLATSTGQILWRTPLAQAPTSLIAAPGGRIAVLHNGATSDPSSVQVFDGTSGALLSTLPLPPSVSQQVLAAGQTDLFVIGDYSSAFDFNPGSGTDKPSSTRGVYISRYSF
jgi:outer membrane protein assembly factor BamB